MDNSIKYNRKIVLFSSSVVMTCVLLIVVWVILYKNYGFSKKTQKFISKVEKLNGEIVHMDEVLTMSARMAVASGNVMWEKRYLDFEPKLEKSITEAIQLMPDEYKKLGASQTDAANIKLVEMERKAFGLVRRGEANAAHAILYSAEYKDQKQIYKDGIDKFVNLLNGQVETKTKRIEKRLYISLAFIFGVVVFLIICWLIVLRTINKWDKEIKILHEKELHSEKLASIGKLSATFAHEFNSPLQGVLYVLEMTVEKCANNKREEIDKEFVKMAVKECDRMAGLVRHLKDFHRPSTNVATLMDIHEVIEDVILLMNKRLQDRGVALKRKFEAGFPLINAVEDQIKQVMFNLIQNAEEAIPDEGGKITIITKRSDSNIKVSIKDTGGGIPDDKLPLIFEPFFTTKGAVKGTGLGLSVCHGIIKMHGGDISVDSNLGKGATFSFVLPVNS